MVSDTRVSIRIPPAFFRGKTVEDFSRWMEDNSQLSAEETATVYRMQDLAPPPPGVRLQVVLRRADVEKLARRLKEEMARDGSKF